MNVRAPVVLAIRLAFRSLDYTGYMHRVHIMRTSLRWSSL
jgi:hypothetical protein